MQQLRVKHDEKWKGSPSSTLPFTYSRTANKHWRNKQMWPHYSAAADVNCAVTQTKRFKRFYAKQRKREVDEVKLKIAMRHAELRQKQRGALTAAIEMTQQRLPNKLDAELEALLTGIIGKLYAVWSQDPNSLYSLPSTFEAFDKKETGLLPQGDIISALQMIGVYLEPNESQLLLSILPVRAEDANHENHFGYGELVEMLLSWLKSKENTQNSGIHSKEGSEFEQEQSSRTMPKCLYDCAT